MAFMATIQPGLRTIATLRGHPPKVGDLLLPVFNPYRVAGLTEIGSVSLDGNVQTSASVDRAMSYGRMRRQGKSKLVAEAAAQVDRAKATDTAQTREHGAERRRDQTPDWMASGAARSSSSKCRIDLNLDDVARRNVLPALRPARLSKLHSAGNRCRRAYRMAARPIRSTRRRSTTPRPRQAIFHKPGGQMSQPIGLTSLCKRQRGPIIAPLIMRRS
jgi:hypothetical protein